MVFTLSECSRSMSFSAMCCRNQLLIIYKSPPFVWSSFLGVDGSDEKRPLFVLKNKIITEDPNFLCNSPYSSVVYLETRSVIFLPVCTQWQCTSSLYAVMNAQAVFALNQWWRPYIPSPCKHFWSAAYHAAVGIIVTDLKSTSRSIWGVCT